MGFLFSAMSEIKYTTDGKKVVVIGSLNAQEKIVQEVLVSNGAEIPSGENFVVKSLHDAPAKSWKQVENEKVELLYNTRRKKLEDEIETYTRRYKNKIEEIEQRIAYATKVGKSIAPESFQVLIDFLLGNIKWVVKTGYELEIIPFDKFHNPSDYGRELKLISIFGKDDGTLRYGLSSYSDGSGMYTNFYPFNCFEDAESFAQSELDKKEKYGYRDLEFSSKFNLKLNPEKFEAYRAGREKEIQTQIDQTKKAMEKTLANLAEIQSLTPPPSPTNNRLCKTKKDLAKNGAIP